MALICPREIDNSRVQVAYWRHTEGHWFCPPAEADGQDAPAVLFRLIFDGYLSADARGDGASPVPGARVVLSLTLTQVQTFLAAALVAAPSDPWRAAVYLAAKASAEFSGATDA